jgi:hypothetical protein
MGGGYNSYLITSGAGCNGNRERLGTLVNYKTFQDPSSSMGE